MVHTEYIKHERAAESLESVRVFLADLRVFECLFDLARDQQQFIYSWMQNLWISDNDETPPWQLHGISNRLVANVQEVLRSSLADATKFFSAIKVSLKVSKFLLDASEFVYCFRVSQATFNSIQSFSPKHPKLECTSIRYQYEALCLMLQSMNAYSMYMEPEHRQIFYVTAPEFLHRMSRLALILQAIASFETDPQTRDSRLLIAKDLHLLSLDICEKTFGVWNVLTAKHIRNLGRIFQTLKRSTLAKPLYLKAISIKERFLGPNDYEVGISIALLANLYNYHMREYKKAEALYLRSVQI
ncbi:unnamed protein product, partial [Rodentolepis nana]|uniref:TPR_REGION domain-containing protein n=1 Tax=Rodentolepis nana TaxID=102285 RepID=A0A0R3U014_RODNA